MKHKKKNFDSQLKKYWNKFWFFVWKDDSIKGWIISIIFIFILIKFIFFPLLSFMTGTSLPLAIVESCSMYHDKNMLSDYEEWWGDHFQKYNVFNINKEKFEDFTFSNGFNKGDILFIVGVDPKNVKIGDVIIFDANKANPLIHRVINIEIDHQTSQRIFSTIGDNNNGQLTIEKAILEKQIIGKAVFKIAPYLGWGKLIIFELSKEIDNNPNTNLEGLCEED